MKSIARIQLAFVVLISISGVGCAHKYSLLNTHLVSVTETEIDETKAKKVGDVSVRYCTGDTATAKENLDSYQVGLMDEVIHKAQEETKSSYIMDAHFKAQGNCIFLDGIAMKL